MSDEQPTLGMYQGIPCHHWPEELPVIAQILQEHQPRTVVEFGTMYGGFAAFLADQVEPWGGRVLTIDWEIFPGLMDVLAPRRRTLQFLCADIQDPNTEALIEATIHPGPTDLLYIDSGADHRADELDLWGRRFALVGVHDYGQNIEPGACASWAERWAYTPVREAEFAAIQAAHGGYFTSRFWSWA